MSYFIYVKCLIAKLGIWRNETKGDKQMNNAIIYARYSSAGQNEQSIEAQTRICKEFAENKGLTGVNIYAY
jgi:hypothetical protein